MGYSHRFKCHDRVVCAVVWSHQAYGIKLQVTSGVANKMNTMLRNTCSCRCAMSVDIKSGKKERKKERKEERIEDRKRDKNEILKGQQMNE